MPSLTTTYSLNKPLVNNATDQDLWGGYLNDNFDTIDTQMLLSRDFKKRAITGTDSVVAGDRHKILLCDATSAAFTLTLLAAATAADGFTLTIVKTDATAHAVTLDGNASETIGGATTFALSGQGDAATLVCDGSNWNFQGNKTTPSAVASASTTAQGIIEIATSAETITGTDAVRAVTPEGLAAKLATLITSVSTSKLVVGVVTIQWGIWTSSSQAGVAQTFGTAFSNTPYAVVASGASYGAPTYGVHVDSVSSSGCTVHCSSAQQIYYIAIGPT